MTQNIYNKIKPKIEVKHVSTGYMPRHHQQILHSQLNRFNVLVCHRRFGKTVFALNEMIDHALRNKMRNPQYAYIGPTIKQAKKVAWQYLVDYTRNIPGVRPNKSDSCIYIDREDDVITLWVTGADDPDAIRGMYLDGAIIDEFAQMDPDIWGKVVRPALGDRKKNAALLGIKLIPWCIFIGTPQGQNHFYKRFKKANKNIEFAQVYKTRHDVKAKELYYDQFEKDLGIHDSLPTVERDEILKRIAKAEKDAYLEFRKYKASCSWFTAVYKASETGILGQDEIDDMCEDLSPEEIEQELECSWTAAILGSYFGHLINKIEKEGHITRVPYDPKYPVDTFWDIGVGDKTTIWFRQKVMQKWHYIDYYENNGKGVDHYIGVLREKGYVYGRHVWPHDGRNKEFGTGETRQETARKQGLRVEIQSKHAKEDQIQAGRNRIPLSYFDAEKCARGIDCLYNYQKEWDSKKQLFGTKPKHDWASDGADSFMYSSLDNRVSTFDPFGTQRRLPIKKKMEYNEFA
jgi:hypothetical protein